MGPIIGLERDKHFYMYYQCSDKKKRLSPCNNPITFSSIYGFQEKNAW